MKVGLDSVERLEKFFVARGQKNLVLRVVDLLELRKEDQETVASVCYLVFEEKAAALEGSTYKRFFSELSREGEWLVLPIAAFLHRLSIQGAAHLQQAILTYQEIRKAKGEPCRVVPCPKCHGSNAKCKHCDGEGIETTILEISPQEQELSTAEVAL